MIHDLITKLKTEIEDLFTHRGYGDQMGEFADIQVFLYHLPKRKAMNSVSDGDYPFVVLRPIKTAIALETEYSVDILAGTYSDNTEEGGRDIDSILTRIALWLKESGVVDNRYGVAGLGDREEAVAINFGMDEMGSQGEPFFVGYINTSWMGPGVEYIGEE